MQPFLAWPSIFRADPNRSKNPREEAAVDPTEFDVKSAEPALFCGLYLKFKLKDSRWKKCINSVHTCSIKRRVALEIIMSFSVLFIRVDKYDELSPVYVSPVSFNIYLSLLTRPT